MPASMDSSPSASPDTSASMYLTSAPKRKMSRSISKQRSLTSQQVSKEQVDYYQEKGLLNPGQQANLNLRHASVVQHFNTALGVDDFMSRLEVALSGFGFTGDNTIACTNLCRDEVTVPLKDKIESVFGGSFNTNGLGAVLTCGVTGIGAGLSHSPISEGKEHYVFFAFPHIAINSAGEVGVIARPGRPNKSCACGALAKCLDELKAEGYESNCKVPGVHDPLDPEYSILKQRLARRARYEEIDVNVLDMVSITKLAERTISTDMEYLAEKVCDTRKANYAVVTGVQIHNWATELTMESGIPSLEFVATAKCYVVIDGVKTHLDLNRVPPLSPRQLQILAKASIAKQKHMDEAMISKTQAGTLKEVPLRYLMQRLGVTRDPEDVVLQEESAVRLSAWTASIATDAPCRDDNVPTMDGRDYTSFKVHDNHLLHLTPPHSSSTGSVVNAVVETAKTQGATANGITLPQLAPQSGAVCKPEAVSGKVVGIHPVNVEDMVPPIATKKAVKKTKESSCTGGSCIIS